MRRIVIFGDRVFCFVLVRGSLRGSKLLSESTTFADRRRTPATFVCDSGPAEVETLRIQCSRRFKKGVFSVFEINNINCVNVAVPSGGGNAPRPGVPIMLYTINRNYSITSLSFALRLITKRSRQHDNSIQSEGRTTAPGQTAH